MRRISANVSFALLGSLAVCLLADLVLIKTGSHLGLAPAVAWANPQQAAGQKPTGWSGREEYDAFTAMASEKEPNKRLSLADAFLQKYSNSFVRDQAQVTKMQTYAQLGDSTKAIEAGHKALEANPDNLVALGYLSFAFPFVFKGDDLEAATKLSSAESNAKRALEALQKIQKPENISDDQFQQYIKGQRAIFNGTVGFVALQRKDYAAAVTSFKTAAEDNPADIFTFYRLGISYISQEPRDYDHAVWNLARSVSLAKAASNPAGADIEKYLKQVYINFHGNDQGLADIINQAAASPNAPEGFKVAAMETPKETGNASIDGFNQTFFPLKLGGERAQKIWDHLKGQPFGVGGYIDSVEKGSEPSTYLVRIDVLNESKGAERVYDIELVDSTQPNVKNFSKGDAVHFSGTISSYTNTPSLVITLADGKINEEEIPDQPKATAKPKPRPAPTRRTPPRRPTTR